MVATDARQGVTGLMMHSLDFEMGSCSKLSAYDLSFSVPHSVQPIIVTRAIRRPKQAYV